MPPPPSLCTYVVILYVICLPLCPLWAPALHVISSVQRESGQNSCIRHGYLNLCQDPVGKTKLACTSVSPWDTDYISVSSSRGRGKRVAPGGEAVASGPATICLSSPALLMPRVMHRSDRVIFFPPSTSAQHSIYTNPFFESAFLLAKWKAIGLFTHCQWNLFLFLEQDEMGEDGESDCTVSGADRVPAQAALQLFLPEMIFWHLFTEPRWKQGGMWRKPL